MAETLGSLVDKLSILKLKQYHSDDYNRLTSLEKQELQLVGEIDEYITGVFSGEIAIERLSFESNKVYKKEGNAVNEVVGSIGTIASNLAHINCQLWHVQEKVYKFENVPANEKNNVVKQLAVLNLERTKCIDEIDQKLVTTLNSNL